MNLMPGAERKKYDDLIALLREMKSVAVAFSGGTDSSFLLAAAKEALGNRAIAVINRSPVLPARELGRAIDLAKRLRVRCEVIDIDETSDTEFAANPPNRCYLCKKKLFTAIKATAARNGAEHVIEGSNADDAGDYRPGMLAVKELGIRSPLLELHFTKDEIRNLSREMGLPTWDKPSFACLASRIPYGEAITKDKLNRIERAEDAINDLGIKQVRVRAHGHVARIEVDAKDIPRLADPGLRVRLVELIKECGYQYVCLDLYGYRTGSMNETLKQGMTDKAPKRENDD